MSNKHRVIIICGEKSNENVKSILGKALDIWSSKLANRSDVIEGITTPWILQQHNKDKSNLVLKHDAPLVEMQVMLNTDVDTLNEKMEEVFLQAGKKIMVVFLGRVKEGNGDWVLKDGVYSPLLLQNILKDEKVSSSLSACESHISIFTSKLGLWNDPGLYSRESLHSEINFVIQVMDPMEVHLPISEDGTSPSVQGTSNTTTTEFDGLLSDLSVVLNKEAQQSVFNELQPPTEEGFLKIRNPCIYVFPGGNGDSAVFAINRFNMLVNGGSLTSPSYWKLVRHLDRIDSVLCTHNGSDNLVGINMLLSRKQQEMAIRLKMADIDRESPEFHEYRKLLISPEIGPIFFNPPNTFTVDRTTNGHDSNNGYHEVSAKSCTEELVNLIKDLGLSHHPLSRKGVFNFEPLTLFAQFGVGKLDMYVLNPLEGSKELDFIKEKWGVNGKSKTKGKTGVTNADDSQGESLLSHLASICCLLVWQPSSPDEKIVRVLFTGNTPETKILEGFQSIKHLNILKAAHMTDKIAKEFDVKVSKPSITKSRPISARPTKNGTSNKEPVKEQPAPPGGPRVKREAASALKSADKRPKTDKPPPKPRGSSAVSDVSKSRPMKKSTSSSARPKSTVENTKSKTESNKAANKADTKPKTRPVSARPKVTVTDKTSLKSSTKPAAHSTSKPTATTRKSPQPAATTKKSPNKTGSTPTPTTRTKKMSSAKTPEKPLPAKATPIKTKLGKKSLVPSKTPATPPEDLTLAFNEMKKEEAKTNGQHDAESNQNSPALSKRTSPEGEDVAAQQKFNEISVQAITVANVSQANDLSEKVGIMDDLKKNDIPNKESTTPIEKSDSPEPIVAPDLAIQINNGKEDKVSEEQSVPEQGDDKIVLGDIGVVKEEGDSPTKDDKVEDTVDIKKEGDPVHDLNNFTTKPENEETESLEKEFVSDENLKVESTGGGYMAVAPADNGEIPKEDDVVQNKEEDFNFKSDYQTEEVDNDQVSPPKPAKSISFVDSAELEERAESIDSAESRKKIEERDVTPFPSSNESASDVTPSSDAKEMYAEDVDYKVQEANQNVETPDNFQASDSTTDIEIKHETPQKQNELAIDLQSSPNSSLEGSYELIASNQSPLVSDGTSKQVETLADATIPEIKEDSVSKENELKVHTDDNAGVVDGVSMSSTTQARMDSPLTTEQQSSLVSADVHQGDMIPTTCVSSRPTEDDISSLLVKSADPSFATDAIVASSVVPVAITVHDNIPVHFDQKQENILLTPEAPEGEKESYQVKDEQISEKYPGPGKQENFVEEEDKEEIRDDPIEAQMDYELSQDNIILDSEPSSNKVLSPDSNMDEFELHAPPPMNNLQVEGAFEGFASDFSSPQRSDIVAADEDEEDYIERESTEIVQQVLDIAQESEGVAQDLVGITPSTTPVVSNPDPFNHFNIQQSDGSVQLQSGFDEGQSPLKPTMYTMEELKNGDSNEKNDVPPDFYFDGPNVKDYSANSEVIPKSDLSLTPEDEKQGFDLHADHKDKEEDVSEETMEEEEYDVQNEQQYVQPISLDSDKSSSSQSTKSSPRYNPAYLDESAPLADVEATSVQDTESASHQLNPLADPFTFEFQKQDSSTQQVDPIIEADPNYGFSLSENNPFMEDLLSNMQSTQPHNTDTTPPVRQQDPCAADKAKANLIQKNNSTKTTTKRGGKPLSAETSGGPFYVDMAYVPHHANSNSVSVNFFKKIRARYYVVSGCDATQDEPSLKVLNALLDGKQTWHKPENDQSGANVTVLPTHDSPTLKQWYQDNYKKLEDNNIHLVASGSKVLVQNEGIEACKIEF